MPRWNTVSRIKSKEGVKTYTNARAAVISFQLSSNTEQINLEAETESRTEFVGENRVGRVLKTNECANLIASKVFVEKLERRVVRLGDSIGSQPFGGRDLKHDLALEWVHEVSRLRSACEAHPLGRLHELTRAEEIKSFASDCRVGVLHGALGVLEAVELESDRPVRQLDVLGLRVGGFLKRQ